MYTDPGSGLFFVQVLIAGILTAAYRFRRALAAIFARTNKSNSDSGR